MNMRLFSTLVSILVLAFLCLGTTAAVAACPCPVTASSYCVTVPPGFSMIANHLDIGGNDVSSVFSSVTPPLPNNTKIYKAGACDNEGNPKWLLAATWNSTTKSWSACATLAPGDGAMIYNPGPAFCVNFTGVPRVPVLPLTVPGPGFFIASRQTPAAGLFATDGNILGYPPCKGTIVYRWINGINGWVAYSFNGTVWNPNEPSIGVGESVVIFQPSPCLNNDNCLNCLPLPVSASLLPKLFCSDPPVPPGSIRVNNTTATPDGSTSCLPGGSDKDVWYCFTPKCDGLFTIWTCNSTFDPVLSIHTGCPGLANEIACNDDDDDYVKCGSLATPTESYLLAALSGGTKYWIRLAGVGGQSGSTCLSYAYAGTVPVGVPPNDNPCNATPIGIETVSGSLVSATATQDGDGVTPLIPFDNIANRATAISSPPDVWYRYTPDCSGLVTIDTWAKPCFGNPFDTVLSVYEGLCSSLSPILGTYCNDDALGFCANNPLASKLTFDAMGGKTYWIRVSGWYGARGSFALSLTQVSTTPANDLCNDAISVTAGLYPFNNCSAGTDGPGAEPINHDLWYKYIASGDCVSDVTVDTCGSAFDTATAVYSSSSGNCSTLTLVPNGYNDNICDPESPCDPSLSSVTFAATPGTTYFIRVGGIGAAVGTGKLTIQGPNPPVRTCPSGGDSDIKTTFYYEISGSANSIGWSWSLTAPCCLNIEDRVVPGQSTLALVAEEFVVSINTKGGPPVGGCVLATVKGIPSGNPVKYRLKVVVKPIKTPPVCPDAINTKATLKVGPMNCPPTCVVPVQPYEETIVTGPCHFNPDIVQLKLSGLDCNGNGEDDMLDIADGTSQDVNSNGIPDECEPCLAPYLFGKPGLQIAQTGQSAGFTVLARGTAPLAYQWLKDGVSVVSNANTLGATTEALTLNNVSLTNAGLYQVVITNACGAITSGPVSLVAITGAVSSVSLVSTGAVWKYLNTGTNLGTTWTGLGFDDSGWNSDPAELGYGDAGAPDFRPENTVVGFGPDSNNKHVTTYFRQKFTVADPSIFGSLVLRLLRDDGAVVHINGQEALRSNMTNGPIGYATLAASTVSGADEAKFYPFSISPAYLEPGTNVIAVEIHQVLPNSPDISFDLGLEGQLPYIPPPSSEIATNLTLPGPFMVISRSGNQITIAWSGRPGFQLRESTNLLNWQSVLNATNPYTLTSPTNRKYYRLVK